MFLLLVLLEGYDCGLQQGFLFETVKFRLVTTKDSFLVYS